MLCGRMLLAWAWVWTTGEAVHQTFNWLGPTTVLPYQTTTYIEDSIIRCCLRCQRTPGGCWLLSYNSDLKECIVADSDKVTKVTNLTQPALMYAPTSPRRVVAFMYQLWYDEAQAFCGNYGGKLHTPHTQAEVTYLQSLVMSGYVGLQVASGGGGGLQWVEADGTLFSPHPDIWHPKYPTHNGGCVRVIGDKLLDFNCTLRTRKFACEFGSN